MGKRSSSLTQEKTASRTFPIQTNEQFIWRSQAQTLLWPSFFFVAIFYNNEILSTVRGGKEVKEQFCAVLVDKVEGMIVKGRFLLLYIL